MPIDDENANRKLLDSVCSKRTQIVKVFGGSGVSQMITINDL